MDIRVERYKEAMRKSRTIGIVGALVLVLCAVREISRFYSALSVNEMVGGAAIQKALLTAGLAALVGIIAFWRACVLAWSRSYGWQLFSWWLVVVAFGVYFWRKAWLRQQNMICDENGVCFGIYDMASGTDFLLLGGTVYMLLSMLRFIATTVFAATQNRLK